MSFLSQKDSDASVDRIKEKAEQRAESPSEPERTGGDLSVLAAGAAVLLSWYVFYARGDRHQGLFIALWPPTILGFASYLKQKSMEERLEQSMLAGSTINNLRKMLQ